MKETVTKQPLKGATLFHEYIGQSIAYFLRLNSALNTLK